MSMKHILFLFIAGCICFKCASNTTKVLAVENKDTTISLDNYADFQLNTKFLINYKDTLSYKKEELWITFDSLLTDSRCPKNVKCIWAGKVDVQLIISNNKNVEKIILSTLNDNEKSKNIFNYMITLMSVRPYPHTDSLYTKKDYSLNLNIKKVY